MIGKNEAQLYNNYAKMSIKNPNQMLGLDIFSMGGEGLEPPEAEGRVVYSHMQLPLCEPPVWQKAERGT